MPLPTNKELIEHYENAIIKIDEDIIAYNKEHKELIDMLKKGKKEYKRYIEEYKALGKN